ncbi:MAG: hypothetical protein R2882_08210 [Gemmatimonadales bacterium]
MGKWLRRLRGALGMGPVWGAAWSGAGVLVALGFLLTTGARADAPFPLLFGFFGFVAGVLFSGLLGMVEGRRRFEQMSLRRFAVWGGIGGFVLATTFVGAVALGGDLAFPGEPAGVRPPLRGGRRRLGRRVARAGKAGPGPGPTRADGFPGR